MRDGDALGFSTHLLVNPEGSGVLGSVDIVELSASTSSLQAGLVVLPISGVPNFPALYTENVGSRGFRDARLIGRGATPARPTLQYWSTGAEGTAFLTPYPMIVTQGGATALGARTVLVDVVIAPGFLMLVQSNQQDLTLTACFRWTETAQVS